MMYTLDFTQLYRWFSSSHCGLHHTFPHMNLESVSPLEAAFGFKPQKKYECRNVIKYLAESCMFAD